MPNASNPLSIQQIGFQSLKKQTLPSEGKKEFDSADERNVLLLEEYCKEASKIEKEISLVEEDSYVHVDNSVAVVLEDMRKLFSHDGTLGFSVHPNLAREISE